MTGGLDPTLGAILPLVGVVIGALLNVVISAAANRKRRAREAKVAARLVGEDLMRFLAASGVGLGARRWEAMATALGEEETFLDWTEHRARLAEELSAEEWRLLRITVRRMERVAYVARNSPKPAIGDQWVPFLEGARDYALQSLMMLEGVADVGLYSRRRGRPSSEEIGEGLFTGDPFAEPPQDEDDQGANDRRSEPSPPHA
jgi:hypothetical protein